MKQDETLKSATPVAAVAPSVPASGSSAPFSEKKKEEPSEADKEKAEESASAGLAALFG